MAPKAAAKPPAKPPEKTPAKPPEKTPGKESKMKRTRQQAVDLFTFKPIYPRTATLIIGLFGFFFFCIFVWATISYISLISYPVHLFVNPLKEVRERCARIFNDSRLNSYSYTKVAAHYVPDLPKQINIVTDDYYSQHHIYSHLFEKGRVPVDRREEWEVFDRSLYYISQVENTWYDAEYFCKMRNAHLVSIQTEEEQIFLTAQLNNLTWIGLSDGNVEGKWEWTDGSLLLKQYWTRGVPSIRSDYSDCAYIDPFVGIINWEHSECFELRRWVCKESLDVDTNPIH